MLPKSYTATLSGRIDRAGLVKTDVERYLALKVGAAVAAGLISGILGIAIGGAAVVLLPILVVAPIWFLPDIRLDWIANARETEIERQMPDVLDQLTISIEAGLGFDAAMSRLVQSSKGPLVDQLARILQDMRFGASREEALKSLAQRTGSSELRRFANAMALAGRHGIAVGAVLRAQAAESREKRKFRAQEAANKVPVKILIPLVLFVLPTLFIVLLGPAVIRYRESFGR